MPTAKQLAEAIADEFLNPKFRNKDLMRVAEIAHSQAGSSRFNQWIREFFEVFEPTEAHKELANFQWRAIVTTNYDLLVEHGYRANQGRLQEIVKRVKDDEPIESMLSRFQYPVEYVKLHGCIEHVHDKDIPLVLTPESYNDHEANRQDLYNRLEGLANEYTIIFCGHSLNDLHIRRLVENPRRRTRPMYYLVSPDFEDEERQMWSDKRVEAISGTFTSFMQALNIALPPLMRIPVVAEMVVQEPYRKHFRVSERESDETAFAFKNEIRFLSAGMKITDVDPKKFYAGFDQSWGNIARDFDIQRRVSSQVLEYIGSGKDEMTQLAVIHGPAGYGKSIALMRAAWELSVSFGEFVVWLDDDSKLRPDVLKEVFNLSGKRIYIFIDRSGLNCLKIEEILALSKAERIPVTIVSAERRNEWSIYCQRLEKYQPQFFEINKLSEAEISDLLEKLRIHGCEGILSGETKDKKRQMIVERLDRQLLVALYEITRGRSFQEIVVDEYSRLPGEDAQKLYLDVCTLDRFDVPARAGVISRISGIAFRDFESELFVPLQDLVFTKQNSITSDWEYRTRHPIVAEIIFNSVCRTDEDRRDQIIRLLYGLDSSYRSDELALSQLLRGRSLAETFEDASLVRQIYDVAVQRNPARPFISQQRAVFEYTHLKGQLDEADAAISTALNKEPKNPSFLHTQAQVYRRRALETKSDFARSSFRAKSRAALDKIPDQTNAYVLGTRARLRVDSVGDALSQLRASASDVHEDQLAEAIDQAEIALHRAFNMYPADPDFLEAEAKLKELLGDTAASTDRLQRAWQRMPRGSGIAKRLSRRYLSVGKTDLAIKVLMEAAERDPTDRSVNLLLSCIHFEQSGIDDVSAQRFLAKSFVSGDREYHARFVAAAVLFAQRQFEKSYGLIDEIDKGAPRDFYPNLGWMERWLIPHFSSYSGVLSSSFGSYVFIRMEDCPRHIFAPVSKSADEKWDVLRINDRVNFDVEFARKGPVGVNVRKV